MTPRPPMLATAAAVLLAALSIGGCGSTSSTPTSPTPTPTAKLPPPVVDSCLVGTWKSSNQTSSYVDGTTTVPLSGGSGELLTLNADGSFTDGFGDAQALTGTANGHQYIVSVSGDATGRYTAAAGQVTATYDDPTKIMISLGKDGSISPVQSPATQTESYTCQKGVSFTATSASGSVTQYLIVP